MKKVLSRKRIDLKKRIKAFSICSKNEDKECKTQIRKSFTYAVDWAKESKPVSKSPLVFIRKSINSKKRIETFGFHVKGYFYVTYKREVMRVRFNHTLDIENKWKAKNFSPEKSASLT